MKHTPSLYSIERKSCLALYITAQLLHLEHYESTDQVTAARALRELLLSQLDLLDIPLNGTAPAPLVSGLAAATITMVPDTTVAAAEPAKQMAPAARDTAQRAEDILKQIRSRQNTAAPAASANTDWVLSPERGTAIIQELIDLRLKHAESTGNETLRKHSAALYSAPEPERYIIYCLLSSSQFGSAFFTKRNDVQPIMDYAKKTTKCRGISVEYWQNREQEWCKVSWADNYNSEADFRKNHHTKLWEKFAPTEFTSLSLQQLQNRVREAIAA
jgi:hypothetical protein